MGPKTLIHCSNEELQEWAKGQWETLKTYLNEAVLLLPTDARTILYRDEELSASLLGGNVTISPEVFKANSIGGIRERPGWVVTIWRHEAETEFAPADFVPYIEEQTSRTIGASLYAIKLAFCVLAEDWAERIDTQESAKEFEQGQ